MSGEHIALARVLAATSEDQLSDGTDPTTFSLAIDCARSAYAVGTLYLHALQSWQHAMRGGSPLLVRKLAAAVGRTRMLVLADAGALGA